MNTEENLKEIDKIQEDLEKIRSKRMEGVAIRARVRWIDKGEKPTNYFCNLENRNYTNRMVSFLEKQTGETLYKQEDILKEVTDFYSNLYKKKNVQDINLNDIIKEAPTLKQDENLNLSFD